MRNVWFDYDPQIQARLLCLQRDVAKAEAPTGSGTLMQDTSRRPQCAFGDSMTYVYVRFGSFDDARYTPEDRSWNVAFRYRGADPALSWVSGDRLLVAVDGPVEISKQLIRVHGIPIDYRIAPH